MHLITMAHPGEAQGVIEEMDLKKISEHLFGKDDFLLLITGEGPFQAIEKTARTLEAHKVTQITNAGLAGALSDKHKLFDVINIRSVYLIQSMKPAFQSFPLDSEGVDCLTSFERISNGDTKKILSGLGGVVDRELWGVAFAAKEKGIPLRAMKIISDSADSADICTDVRKLADLLSEKLAHAILKPVVKESNPTHTIADFHFTFTTRHRFENLLTKMAIKEEKSSADILQTLELQRYRALEISPKERAKLLLRDIELTLDPTKKMLLNFEQKLKSRFEEKGFRVQLDPQWEKPYLTINLDVQSTEELAGKAKKLSQFSIDDFEKIMKGDFNVE